MMSLKRILSRKHVSSEEMSALLSGEAGALSALLLRRHMERCWSCSARFAGMRQVASQLALYSRSFVSPSGDGARARLERALSHQQQNAEPVAPRKKAPLVAFWRFVPLGLLLMAIAYVWFVKIHSPKADANALLSSASLQESLNIGQSPAVRRIVALTREDPRDGPVEHFQVVEWHMGRRWIMRLQEPLSHARRAEADRRNAHAPMTHIATETSAQQLAPLSSDILWTYLPSPAVYRGLLGPTSGTLQLDTGKDHLLHVRYQDSPLDETATDEPRLLAASLEIRPSDLHAVGQVLLIGERGRQVRYVYREESFTMIPAEEAARQFIEDSPSEGLPSPVMEGAKAPAAIQHGDSLTLAAFDALDKSGLLDEYDIHIGASDASTTVSGVLPAEASVRLDKALAGLAIDPDLRMRVHIAKQTSTKHTPPTLVDGNGLGDGFRMVVQQQTGLEGTELDRVSMESANSLLESSADARQQATAIFRIASLFSREQIQAMSAANQRIYRTTVRRHVDPLRSDLQRLSATIRTVFPHDSAFVDGGQHDAITSARTLAETTEMFDQAVEDSLSQPSYNGRLPVLQPDVLRGLEAATQWVERLSAAEANDL